MKKLMRPVFLSVSLLCLSGLLGGCAYYGNNTGWEDLSAAEKQEIANALEQLDTALAGDTSISTVTNMREKNARIEVWSAQEDMLLVEINAQDFIDVLLSDASIWTPLDFLPDDLTPKYRLAVYQEKTQLAGQNPDTSREYELIATILTYADSDYIRLTITDDMVKNMKLPECLLTFYSRMSAEAADSLQKYLEN